MTKGLCSAYLHPGERRGPCAVDRRRRASITNGNRRNWAPAFSGVTTDDQHRSEVDMHRITAAMVTRTNTRTSATFVTFRA